MPKNKLSAIDRAIEQLEAEIAARNHAVIVLRAQRDELAAKPKPKPAPRLAAGAQS
jgi:hypothetical protein